MARQREGNVVDYRENGIFRRRSRRSFFHSNFSSTSCLTAVATLTTLLVWLAPIALATSPRIVTIEDLGWLAGRWGGEKNGIAMEEHWTDAAGGGLVGMHKDVKAGKMVSFEFFRIAPGAEGRATYFTQPGGMPAIPFVAVEMTTSRVVFENKEHDFPQRILYWKTEDGRLHAKIEGPMNGETVSEEWSWARLSSR